MKDLQKFRQLVEEEKTDYSKFDMLVRAGLANKAQLSRIHRILDKMTEERPQFNNADKEIMRNLFNRMVDLIANNKQIFQKTRQAVREELEEDVVDTSDYKVGPSGRKYKAHRIKVGDVAYGKEDDVKEEFELVEAPIDFDNDPPFVLVLKRRAIRMYPDKTKVALYYSKTLDKYFSVPYGGPMGSVVQAEETQIEEAVMDQLHKIVKEKQAQSVKFGNGQSKKVDHFTASAITQVHNALNDENKKKFADMVHKSPAHLAKASDFAFSRAK
jgi:hypothetical protein